MTVLALNTGMRHKEIRTLRWKDIDLVSRVLRVAESKTRAGEGRPIPLTQPAWAALCYWAERFPGRRSEHFVFPSCENGTVDPTQGIVNWRTAWRRVTRNVQCPACGEIQSPRKICRNVECRVKIEGIKNHSKGFVSTISATAPPPSFWSRVHRSQLWPRSWDGQPAQQCGWPSVTAISVPKPNGKRWRVLQRKKFR